MHDQPDSQSASELQAVMTTRQPKWPVGSHVQSGSSSEPPPASLSGGMGSLESGLGLPAELEQLHSITSSHVKPAPQSDADSQGSR